MNYVNLEVFEKFLEENCKRRFNLEEYLKDFEKRIGETGSNEYELKCWETKSGNPELIRFERTDVYDEYYDCCETTIEF